MKLKFGGSPFSTMYYSYYFDVTVIPTFVLENAPVWSCSIFVSRHCFRIADKRGKISGKSISTPFCFHHQFQITEW